MCIRRYAREEMLTLLGALNKYRKALAVGLIIREIIGRVNTSAFLP